jgi:hypothetical protein
LIQRRLPGADSHWAKYITALPHETEARQAKRESIAAEELLMSARNGDKARFDRERKKNNLRRRRTQELRKKYAPQKLSLEKGNRTFQNGPHLGQEPAQPFSKG